MRSPVAATSDQNGYRVVCDDGSVWERIRVSANDIPFNDTFEWRELEPVPGTAREADLYKERTSAGRRAPSTSEDTQ